MVYTHLYYMWDSFMLLLHLAQPTHTQCNVCKLYRRLQFDCNSEVKKIIACEDDMDSIIVEVRMYCKITFPFIYHKLQPGQWSTYAQSQDGNLFFYYCPPGYCQCFLNTSVSDSSCVNVYVNTDPDRQCVCGRKGNWHA